MPCGALPRPPVQALLCLAAEGPRPGAASGTSETRGSAPGAPSVTKPVPAGCIRTLNEVQRRAAASLSPSLSLQVLLLPSYLGELVKLGPAPQARAPRSRRPGGSPVPRSLMETICSGAGAQEARRCVPPSFLSAPQAAPRGEEPSTSGFLNKK